MWRGFIPVDNAAVEAAENPNPLEAAGVALAGVDAAADDGKPDPDVFADVLAGSEKEGIEEGALFNKEDDVGDAAEDAVVVDPNVDRPKREDDEACVWLGVAIVPNAELAAGAVVAAGVALELKENPEKGLVAVAADDAAAAGVD